MYREVFLKEERAKALEQERAAAAWNARPEDEEEMQDVDGSSRGPKPNIRALMRSRSAVRRRVPNAGGAGIGGDAR